MGEDKREWTLTAKLDDLDWSDWSGQTGFIELEDQTDYILEEDREAVNKYIEKLQKRIRELKCEIADLQGRNETWEKSWRIWNGQE